MAIELKCLQGDCIALLGKGEFYEFYDDLSEAIAKIKPKVGDILSKKNSYHLIELFIVDLDGKSTIKLIINDDLRFLIPQHLVKKLGLFYWNKIFNKANLAEIYSVNGVKKISADLIAKKITVQQLVEKYGQITVKSFIKIKIVPKSRTPCYEARSKKELLDIAKKKGIPLFSNISKGEIIKRLRAT